MPVSFSIFHRRSKRMKATKFWMTAAAAVTTAGMIGVAIAQTQSPTQPVTPTNETPSNVGSQSGALPQTGTTGSATSGSMSTGTAPADAATTDTLPRADRG
jgi:hypothetical protein